MKTIFPAALCLSLLAHAWAHNLFLGERTNDTRLIYRERLVYKPWPWMKRVMNFTYTDKEQRPLKAILCYDYQKTEALVNVTGGGVGFTFINLQIRSQRSYAIDYAIEIFA